MERIFKFLVSVVLSSIILAGMVTTVLANEVSENEEYYQRSMEAIIANQETINDDVRKAYYHFSSDSDLDISDGLKSEDIGGEIDLSNLFCVYSLANGDKEWFYDKNNTTDTILGYIDYERTEWLYEYVIGDWIVIVSYRVSQDGELYGTGTYNARELEKGLTKDVINKTLGGYIENDYILCYTYNSDYSAIIFDESDKAFGFGDLWGTEGYGVFDFDEVKANAIKNTEDSNNLQVQEASEPMYGSNLIDTSKMQTIENVVPKNNSGQNIQVAVVLVLAIIAMIISGRKMYETYD